MDDQNNSIHLLFHGQQKHKIQTKIKRERQSREYFQCHICAHSKRYEMKIMFVVVGKIGEAASTSGKLRAYIHYMHYTSRRMDDIFRNQDT